MAGVCPLACAPALAASASLALRAVDGGYDVLVDGEPFTTYRGIGQPKPILYPVHGPGGVEMTRNFPMRETPGEARDHPHHRSLWFAHGDVNGVDFWTEGPGRGRIEQASASILEAHGPSVALVATNRWVGPGGNVVCRDVRTLRFGTLPDAARYIDVQIMVSASEGEVVFGDTKEGTMALRTHPNLRLANDEKAGVTTAGGRALDSEGRRDRALWGERARWVDYWGPIDGRTVGVAIFDHPSNPRHPTWWHARHYGLVAANPFGRHDFEGGARGAGNLVIPAGGCVVFTYRFLFHEGAADAERLNRQYDAFVQAWPPAASPTQP